MESACLQKIICLVFGGSSPRITILLELTTANPIKHPSGSSISP